MLLTRHRAACRLPRAGVRGEELELGQVRLVEVVRDLHGVCDRGLGIGVLDHGCVYRG